jgi:hypothetical protein
MSAFDARTLGRSSCDIEVVALVTTRVPKPKTWMLLAWVAILAVVVGLSAVYGGRNCRVPTSGPFHRLMQNQEWVSTHSHSFHFAPCKRVGIGLTSTQNQFG